MPDRREDILANSSLGMFQGGPLRASVMEGRTQRDFSECVYVCLCVNERKSLDDLQVGVFWLHN